jgi:hypothetical protein
LKNVWEIELSNSGRAGLPENRVGRCSDDDYKRNYIADQFLPMGIRASGFLNEKRDENGTAIRFDRSVAVYGYSIAGNRSKHWIIRGGMIRGRR